MALFIFGKMQKNEKEVGLKHPSLSNTHNINGFNIDIGGAVSIKF